MEHLIRPHFDAEHAYRSEQIQHLRGTTVRWLPRRRTRRATRTDDAS